MRYFYSIVKSKYLVSMSMLYFSSMMTPVTSVGGGIPGTGVIGDEFYIEVRRCVGEWKDRLYEPPCTDDPHFLAFQQVTTLDSKQKPNEKPQILLWIKNTARPQKKCTKSRQSTR